jgi:hypothetical protein
VANTSPVHHREGVLHHFLGGGQIAQQHRGKADKRDAVLGEQSGEHLAGGHLALARRPL